MADSKTNYGEYFDKKPKTKSKRLNVLETVEPFEIKTFFVKAKSLPVRIRKDPNVNSEASVDKLVCDQPVEVGEVVNGFGSDTGWGKLVDGSGFVSMDHVVKVTK